MTVALLYSVYAIYASGASAVLGGMIVMGIGYVIYGFIAPRFEVKAAAALFLLLAAGSAIPSRRFGGNAGAGPAEREDPPRLRPRRRRRSRTSTTSGKPAGYTVVLCEKVAAALHAKPEFVRSSSPGSGSPP